MTSTNNIHGMRLQRKMCVVVMGTLLVLLPGMLRADPAESSNSSGASQRIAELERLGLYYQVLAQGKTGDSQVKAKMGQIHLRRTSILAALGKHEQAKKECEQGTAIFLALSAKDRNEARYRSSLANAHSTMANLLMSTGELQQSLTENKKAIALYQQLAVADPQRDMYRQNQAILQNNLGQIYVQVGQAEKAILANQEGMAILSTGSRMPPRSITPASRLVIP